MVRNYGKNVVVGREIAFVGGINIIDDSNPADNVPPRYDYAVAVEGPLVEVIRLSARRLWMMVAWSRFHKGTVHDGALPASTFTGGANERGIPRTGQFAGDRAAESEIILAHAHFLQGLILFMHLSMQPGAAYEWFCCCRDFKYRSVQPAAFM